MEKGKEKEKEREESETERQVCEREVKRGKCVC
jgi:hypothetical protein